MFLLRPEKLDVVVVAVNFEIRVAGHDQLDARSERSREPHTIHLTLLCLDHDAVSRAFEQLAASSPDAGVDCDPHAG